MGNVTVDFIAREENQSQWRMVVVEEGPWGSGDIESNLQRVQTRLYGCIDAALDGQLAKLYPDSVDKSLIVQLDCYEVPELQVRAFFGRFSDGVLSQPKYKDAMSAKRFVRGIDFQLNCWRLA